MDMQMQFPKRWIFLNWFHAQLLRPALEETTLGGFFLITNYLITTPRSGARMPLKVIMI